MVADACQSYRSAFPVGCAAGGGRGEANGGPRDWAFGREGRKAGTARGGLALFPSALRAVLPDAGRPRPPPACEEEENEEEKEEDGRGAVIARAARELRAARGAPSSLRARGSGAVCPPVTGGERPARVNGTVQENHKRDREESQPLRVRSPGEIVKSQRSPSVPPLFGGGGTRTAQSPSRRTRQAGPAGAPGARTVKVVETRP